MLWDIILCLSSKHANLRRDCSKNHNFVRETESSSKLAYEFLCARPYMNENVSMLFWQNDEQSSKVKIYDNL